MLSIPEFFRGKNIFITGGCGFLGKVLIEKLLRSCPDVGNVYMLVRRKKGKEPIERIRDTINSELFDGVRSTNPALFDKLIPILGDVAELGLGICKNDRKLLSSNIDIIYNCAASVRFDQPLRDATLTNVRSSRELCLFALECKKLKVLVHVSTAYSNLNRSYIDEKMYPAHVKWQDFLKMAEDEDHGKYLDIMSSKFTDKYPNTYAFTKQISEAVCEEMCRGKVPLIIHRPSIVMYCNREPIVGWVDNLNGPFSLCIPISKGITNVLLAKDVESTLNIVFVDNVAKTLIISAWVKCTESPPSYDVTIYNACSEILWKMKHFEKVMNFISWKYPAKDRIWMPSTSYFCSCWHSYYISLMLFNVLPLLFLDAVLKLSGRKPLLFKLTRKIYLANIALDFFMCNSFTFNTSNYRGLEDRLLECDKKDFDYSVSTKERNIYHMAAVGLVGLKRYVLREKYPIEPQTYRNTYWLYGLDLVVRYLRNIILLYLVLWKLDLLTYIYDKFSQYVYKV